MTTKFGALALLVLLAVVSPVLGNINKVYNTSSSSSSSEGYENEMCDSTWGCEYPASVLIFSFLVMSCGAVLVVYGVAVLKLRYLPESVAVVVYGIVVGVILRFIDAPVAKHLSSFDSEAFFLFILPCIIFETGFSLPKVRTLRESYTKSEEGGVCQ